MIANSADTDEMPQANFKTFDSVDFMLTKNY